MGNFRLLPHHAIDLERLFGGTCQGISLQLQLAAAIVEAGLVYRYAFIAQRLIDFDNLAERFACFMVDDIDIALETAGHAG
ncbi:hypothetical protein D9M72_611930 [compost metagenome]